MNDGSGEVEPAPIADGADPTAATPTAPVSIDRISTTPVEIPDSGSDLQARREQNALNHQLDRFKKELGWLVHPFGGRSEKPGNISALVIVLCFVIIFGAFIVNVWIDVVYNGKNIQMPIAFDKLFSGIMSLMTLVLGYLFGSNDKNEK